MQKSEAARAYRILISEVRNVRGCFIKTACLYNLSAVEIIKSLLKSVGAGFHARPSNVRKQNDLRLL